MEEKKKSIQTGEPSKVEGAQQSNITVRKACAFEKDTHADQNGVSLLPYSVMSAPPCMIKEKGMMKKEGEKEIKGKKEEKLILDDVGSVE